MQQSGAEHLKKLQVVVANSISPTAGGPAESDRLSQATGGAQGGQGDPAAKAAAKASKKERQKQKRWDLLTTDPWMVAVELGRRILYQLSQLFLGRSKLAQPAGWSVLFTLLQAPEPWIRL